MKVQLDNTKSIQMTLFDYFKDVDSFSLADAKECMEEAKKAVKEPSIRGRIYEGIDKGLFERVGKGVYTVKQVKDGRKNTCVLINGNGRDLSMFSDNSIDCIITDHPYKLDKSLKGGNRDFSAYESFQYTQEDLNEKFRVLKDGCYLVEFLPEENGDNYKYIYEIKEMAAKAGLEYYASVDWKKGDFVANTGRKAKNTENIMFFTKGKSRDLRLDAKKNKERLENHVWKQNGSTYLDDVAIDILNESRQMIQIQNDIQTHEDNDNLRKEVNDLKNKIINLQDELKVKTEQMTSLLLENKEKTFLLEQKKDQTEEINRLKEQLDREKKEQLNEIEKLKDELEKEKNKGFFARLFGK